MVDNVYVSERESNPNQKDKMMTTAIAKTLNATKIAETKYNVNILACTWTVVEWCISEVEKTCGAAEAAKQMKAINRKRDKCGKYTNIPAYGTELFNAYFAK